MYSWRRVWQLISPVKQKFSFSCYRFTFLTDGNFVSQFYLLKKPTSIFMLHTEHTILYQVAMLIPTPDQLRIVHFLLFYPNSNSVLWPLLLLYRALILKVARPLRFSDKESLKEANLLCVCMIPSQEGSAFLMDCKHDRRTNVSNKNPLHSEKQLCKK